MIPWLISILAGVGVFYIVSEIGLSAGDWPHA